MTHKPMPLAAIVSGAAILQVANGILGVIVPLHLGLMNKPTPVIGVIITAYSLGFMAGCLRAPSLIRPVGHIRAFAALAAILAVSTLTFVAGDWAPLWAVLRFVGGFCMAGLYTVIESWVTDHSPSDGRGRFLAVYMIFNKVGLIAGQGALALVDMPGSGFYMIACGFAAIAIVPVSLTRTSGPEAREAATMGVVQLYRVAPIGVVGCFGAGLVNSSMLGFLPIFGLKSGISVAAIPLLVAATHFGSMALQWPLGWISDRIDRRHVIVAATGGGSIIVLGVALSGITHVPMLLFLFALWGGLALSVYPLCIAHASDFATPSQLVPLVSSLMLSWAAGSIVGPALATVAMESAGPNGLLYYAAMVSASVGTFAMWRTGRRPPVPSDEREAFVNLPATSPVVATLAVDHLAPEEGRDGDDGTGSP